MDEGNIRLALLLIGPGTLSVFGLSFLWAWMLERKRHYLLLLSGGCVSFALGVFIQVFGWPSDAGVNALVSNFFYISAVLAVSEGLLRRSGKKFGVIYAISVLVMSSVLIWYFFYIDRSLVARIYVQNFGVGFLLLVVAWRLKGIVRGRFIDKALFWMLLGFSIQFFPRTVLTVEPYLSVDTSLFAESLFWQTLQLSLSVLGAGLAFVILAAAITDVIEDLRRERDIDRLTGIFNRRGFEERADLLIHTTGGSMAMVVCDLDHFKKINDSFGHAVGDDVLSIFGSLLRRTVRSNDIAGRIGGEEFAILLPNSGLLDAQGFTKRLHEAIATTIFPLPEGAQSVTSSMGVAVSQEKRDRASLFERADKALYTAKNSGRNRTVFHHDIAIEKMTSPDVCIGEAAG
ncbi:GGDEF domain-containing protein [Halomonas icarae]|uniref:diguanylate cyclase n=1 Tax=Halomonas icarae TaxID=2691040 RepID=A0A7X5AM98_9GAMM|nr:GGDEF domain-containing protein [Halomonas icarae]MDR5903339.1 GGDEF domain-containing protein [Halomonas icarae]NAW13215.1 diguanylate cyclase [Halomonas icarae]